jgi:hypothetical protein
MEMKLITVAARSEGVRLLPFACWDCGFETRRRHGCLCLVSVVCCQVEVSATSWSLVQTVARGKNGYRYSIKIYNFYFSQNGQSSLNGNVDNNSSIMYCISDNQGAVNKESVVSVVSTNKQNLRKIFCSVLDICCRHVLSTQTIRDLVA